jgi:hypothetical protein
VTLAEKCVGKETIKTHPFIHQKVLRNTFLNFGFNCKLYSINGTETVFFREFVEEVSAEFLCRTEVHWFIGGRVFQRFVTLRDEKFRSWKIIQGFLALYDENWNKNMCFLCKIACHLNELKLQLQAKVELVFEMISALKYFKTKVR